MILRVTKTSASRPSKQKKQSKSSFQGLIDTIANLQPIDVAVDFCALHVPEHTFLCATRVHKVRDQGPKIQGSRRQVPGGSEIETIHGLERCQAV